MHSLNIANVFSEYILLSARKQREVPVTRTRQSTTPIDYQRVFNELLDTQQVAVDNDGITRDSSDCPMKSTGWPTNRNTRLFHF